MAKKITSFIKLHIPAGAANPSPPVGPALGQHGVNIMEFCKAFNAKTSDLEKGMKVPVVITVYSDKTFTFITKSPPASTLIKKFANIKKGSGTPNTNKVAEITVAQIEEIVNIKSADMTGVNTEANIRTIEGSARSMGVSVIR